MNNHFYIIDATAPNHTLNLSLNKQTLYLIRHLASLLPQDELEILLTSNVYPKAYLISKSLVFATAIRSRIFVSKLLLSCSDFDFNPEKS